MAADVGENFALETELADRLAIGSGRLGRGRGRELDVLDAERVEGLGDGDFGLGVKECVCELLALWKQAECEHETLQHCSTALLASQCTLNDVEIGDVAEKLCIARGIGVTGLGITRSRTNTSIHGLGGVVGDAVRAQSIHRDHLAGVSGQCISVGMGAHFLAVSGYLEGKERERRMGLVFEFGVTDAESDKSSSRRNQPETTPAT